MPVPVSVTVMATKSPLRAGWARSGGMASTLRTRMVSRPSLFMASRPLTARLISAVSNCAISAIAKQLGSAMSTSILIRAPTSGRISCATASTWVPTLNTCGFSGCRRANASNCPVSLEARSTVSEIASM